jgi:hypothetical protein
MIVKNPLEKRVLVGAAMILLALVLAACAGAEGPQGPEGPPGPPGEGLTEEQAAQLEALATFAESVPFPALEEMLRGCPSCHALVDPETGQYTLPYEAH